jgi:signal peptidase I
MIKILLLLLLLLSNTYSASSTIEQNYKHYIAEGPSMEPTLHQEDKLTVDPDYYKTHDFLRSDLVLFNAPSGVMYVKRVIALPGERIKISGNQVIINDEPLDEPYIADVVRDRKESGQIFNMDFQEVTVPEDTIFVLGDNRLNSVDSRIISSIPTEHILGKVIEIKHVKK